MKTIIFAFLLFLVSCGAGEGILIITKDRTPVCTTEETTGGVLLTCNNETLFIEDGDFTGILEYVEICPNIQPDADYKEVLLQLDGEYVALLMATGEHRLVFLQENITYVTTDGREVYFKVIEDEIICL